MDVVRAAAHWASTWERSWAGRDAAAIHALYAADATYRSHPHRDPEERSGLDYVTRMFEEESSIECRFGEPVAAGDRAAVEWWATYIEDERRITLSGATVLHFDADGLVIDHVDYFVEAEGRIEPFDGWGSRS
jgi:hypothetical protein